MKSPLPFQRGITPGPSSDVESLQRKRKAHFILEAAPGSSVSVVGNFNDWTPGAHPLQPTRDPGVYERIMFLPEGRHEYKFVVDDEWSADAKCPHWVLNEFRTLNSVLYLE